MSGSRVRYLPGVGGGSNMFKGTMFKATLPRIEEQNFEPNAFLNKNVRFDI